MFEFKEPSQKRVFFNDLDGSKREDVITMLQRLYASEIIAMEQYRAHAVDVVGPNCVQMSELFMTHAEEEYGHSKLLMKRIDDLGGSLDNGLQRMTDITTATKLEGHDVQTSEDTSTMVKQDISGEADAIAAYTEGCFLVQHTDPATYVMLAGILADEWEHRTELRNILGLR